MRSMTRCTTGALAAAVEVGEAEANKVEAACGAVPDAASAEVWGLACPELVEGVETVVAACRGCGVAMKF